MIPPTRWLGALETSLAALHERSAPKDIHDVRVATRRLGAWLQLGGRHVLRDDLRWLRQVAGAVRDIDVVLEIEGDPSWSRWLRSERRVRVQSLRSALDAERTAGLLLALRSLPPVARDSGRDHLRDMAARALAAGDALAAAPEDPERFHLLRRKVRILRFGLEWLDEKARALREFQDASGAAADRAVSLRLLAGYPERDQLAVRRAQLEVEYAGYRQAALDIWPPLRERIRAMR